MKGAIFYSSKYGSTAQYAQWISEATGLPVFNADDGNVDPSKYDFLVLGSPIIYFRLIIGKWVRKFLPVIQEKPVIFFSVSGAGESMKLERWVANSLPISIVSRMHHVALRGRQKPEELTFFDRTMLKIASFVNTDRQAARDERYGFDYMDRSAIEPIVEMVEKLQSKMFAGVETV